MTLIHGFELLREQTIPELNSLARLYRHGRTGAELLSLENDDENKCFGIAFRTPPSDSTGIAHILEHTVLGGSRSFRLKDPFVLLLQGSLATFLNAFTFPDRTVYPLASQNLQDFYNLITVYLDAVCYPLLERPKFAQEGWHYEVAEGGDELIYSGVVFNEMKGAFANPDDVLDQMVLKSLFPDTVYGLNSGGDPKHIPDLTYEQFTAFHRTYYHPSNARIFFYGDDPGTERLRYMDKWLQDFDRLEVDSAIALQVPFDQPRQAAFPYNAGEDGKSYLTVNWVLKETTDPETVLGLDILAHILIGTPAAPLRKALIDSGLGEDLAGPGLISELRQIGFSTGLKGIDRAHAGAVEALILDTLHRLAGEGGEYSGIEPRQIEASLNTTEFDLRERNTGGFPRGLALYLAALTTWTYDADPLLALAFEQPLQALKTRLARGERYFETLIRRYFLDNPHRTTVLLEPDTGLQERQDADEAERLAVLAASMTAADLAALQAANEEMRVLQETPDSPEAMATLPRLALADLDRQSRTIPLAELAHDGARILYHDIFTNGITYLDLGFDLHGLDAADLPYAHLLGRALLEMGTGQEDFVSLSQRIGSKTGGIIHQVLSATPRQQRQAAAWLFLRGKAMVGQTSDLLAILKDVLLTARLDNQERFRQIVLEQKATVEAQLLPTGHAVVSSRLDAHFTEAGWAAEQIGGINYLFFLRRLAAEIDQDWPAVLARLQSIRSQLVNRNSLLANVTLDETNWRTVQPQLAGLLDALPAAAPVSTPWTPESLPRHEGMTLPAQVNYVGKGANLFDLGYTPNGSVHVVTRYHNTAYLWERVRLQGGAYAVVCRLDQRSGVLNFASYRDPNFLPTLEAYNQTASFLSGLTLADDEVTRAIVGVIGALDSYMLPDTKGFVSLQRYLLGETDAYRQQVREEVLGTTAADFRAFGQALESFANAGHIVVLGSKTAIEQANDGSWMQVFDVM